MRMKPIICLGLSLWTCVFAAQAQDNQGSRIDTEIKFDETRTIERLNTDTSGTPISHGSELQESTNHPRDLSSQYTEIVKGVPVIIDPKPCQTNGLDLRIKVNNITSSKGFIVADLHNDVVEDFLDDYKVVLRVRAAAQKDAINFCLPLSQPGEYALAIYHDKNNNREFDKGFLGIPKERFGMSNNPAFGLKAPDYEQAAFRVSETGADLTIQLFSSSDILNR